MRSVVARLGLTSTGKTHSALERMLERRTRMMGPSDDNSSVGGQPAAAGL